MKKQAKGDAGSLSGRNTPQRVRIPRRFFGSTGVEVSLLGLGGSSIGDAGSEKEAIRMVREAVDAGVSFMDVMSLPISVLVSGMDKRKVLLQNLEIARNFMPMIGDEMMKLRAVCCRRTI